MTGIGQGKRRQAFRDQLTAAGEVDPVLAAIADGLTQPTKRFASLQKPWRRICGRLPKKVVSPVA
jgi:hypothetical protein